MKPIAKVVMNTPGPVNLPEKCCVVEIYPGWNSDAIILGTDLYLSTAFSEKKGELLAANEMIIKLQLEATADGIQLDDLESDKEAQRLELIEKDITIGRLQKLLDVKTDKETIRVNVNRLQTLLEEARAESVAKAIQIRDHQTLMERRDEAESDMLHDINTLEDQKRSLLMAMAILFQATEFDLLAGG